MDQPKIDRLDPTNTLKATLKNKLSAIYGSTGIAEEIEIVDSPEFAASVSAYVAENLSLALNLR